MFKRMLLKRALDAHLSGVDEAQKEKVLDAFMKNPELFESIAKEIKQRVDAGADQMQATQEVMAVYQQQLSDLFRS